MPLALIGDRIRFSFSFQRLGTTTAATPPVVQVVHRTPSNVETVVTLAGGGVVQDSPGNLHADFRILEARWHHFNAIGSGDPELEKTIPESIQIPESLFDVPLPV